MKELKICLGEDCWIVPVHKLLVLANEIPEPKLMADIKRRINFMLENKYEAGFKRLKTEWEPKLKASGLESIPLDVAKFVELIVSRPDYKDRAKRDLEGVKAGKMWDNGTDGPRPRS